MADSSRRTDKSESSFIQLAREKAKKNKTTQARRLLTFGEVLTEACAPLEHVLFPWLIRQGIALVYAERGIGKTHFAFNVAHTIARGGKYLKWHAAQPRRVLYLDGEMQFAVLKERAEMVARLEGDGANDNLVLLTPDKYNAPMPDLKTIDGQKEIDAHILEVGAEVVVIDNIATLMPTLKGNSNDEWHEYIQPWLLELRQRGIAVIVVHHSGKFKKDEPQTSRGSSAKEDVADTVIRLYRPPDYVSEQGARFNVEFTKNRHFYGEDAAEFEAWLKPDEDSGHSSWHFDNPVKPKVELAADLYRKGLSQKEISEQLGLTPPRVSTLIKKAIERGLLPAGTFNNK